MCPLEGFNSLQNCVTLRQTICLQPYTEGILPIEVPQKYRNMSVLIEPLINECALPVKVAGTICNTRGRGGLLRVLNATAETVTIRRFTKLGTLSTLNSISSIQPFVRPKQTTENNKNENQNPETLEAFAKKYGLQTASDLTQEQLYELLNVLYEFRDTFALEIIDMKIHQKYVAHLELKHPGTTVRSRQFPLSREDAAEIDRQILEMKEIGLIEKSEDTTFNSSIFLIKKKHIGKTRFVVDLRKVNDILKPLTVMLPRIDDVLQEIAFQKPTVYSSFDLFKGFWAIPLEKNRRKYTNFYSPQSGIPYRYCTLPIGLQASSAHFQRMAFAIFHNK